MVLRWDTPPSDFPHIALSWREPISKTALKAFRMNAPHSLPPGGSPKRTPKVPLYELQYAAQLRFGYMVIFGAVALTELCVMSRLEFGCSALSIDEVACQRKRFGRSSMLAFK